MIKFKSTVTCSTWNLRLISHDKATILLVETTVVIPFALSSLASSFHYNFSSRSGCRPRLSVKPKEEAAHELTRKMGDRLIW